MAKEAPPKSQDTRLGERRVYRPVIGWDYDKPPDDLKPVVSGLWWMGYRLEKEQDNLRKEQHNA